MKGKIKIVNTFVLSKLWYALEVHNISKEMLQEVKDIVRNFIWNGYCQRDWSTLCYPYNIGGLALQNIEIKMETQRIKWLERLRSEKHLFF